MKTRPPDLTDAAVAAGVSDGWGLPPLHVSYLPVGYGSHHWLARDAAGRRWFASVDALATAGPRAGLERLADALGLAVAAADAGMTFVLPPLRAVDGTLVQLLGSRHALALYPYVDGDAGDFGDALTRADGAELTRLLCSLHSVPVSGSARVDDLEVPGRDRLEAVLGSGQHAGSGPYGTRVRDLLARRGDDIRSALVRHDALVASAGRQDERLVLTHGEPHPGNLLRTSGGVLLIDWDSALLAPPERDLWFADTRTPGRARGDYETCSGRMVSAALLERYQIAWALADVGHFVDLLVATAEETADTAWSWHALDVTVRALGAAP